MHSMPPLSTCTACICWAPLFTPVPAWRGACTGRATPSLKLRAFWPANHWLQYGVAWRSGANLTLVDMFDALVLSQQEDGTISQVHRCRMPCCC